MPAGKFKAPPAKKTRLIPNSLRNPAAASAFLLRNWIRVAPGSAATPVLRDQRWLRESIQLQYGLRRGEPCPNIAASAFGHGTATFMTWAIFAHGRLLSLPATSRPMARTPNHSYPTSRPHLAASVWRGLGLALKTYVVVHDRSTATILPADGGWARTFSPTAIRAHPAASPATPDRGAGAGLFPAGRLDRALPILPSHIHGPVMNHNLETWPPALLPRCAFRVPTTRTRSATAGIPAELPVPSVPTKSGLMGRTGRERNEEIPAGDARTCGEGRRRKCSPSASTLLPAQPSAGAAPKTNSETFDGVREARGAARRVFAHAPWPPLWCGKLVPRGSAGPQAAGPRPTRPR